MKKRKRTEVSKGFIYQGEIFLEWLEMTYPSLYEKYKSMGSSSIAKPTYEFAKSIGAVEEHVETFEELKNYIINNEHLHDWWLL